MRICSVHCRRSFRGSLHRNYSKCRVEKSSEPRYKRVSRKLGVGMGDSYMPCIRVLYACFSCANCMRELYARVICTCKRVDKAPSLPVDGRCMRCMHVFGTQLPQVLYLYNHVEDLFTLKKICQNNASEASIGDGRSLYALHARVEHPLSPNSVYLCRYCYYCTTAGAVPVRQPCGVSEGLRDASPLGATSRRQQFAHDRGGGLAFETIN